MIKKGWDYNVTKMHVNYAHHPTPLPAWTLAIQSEKVLGVPCPKPENFSFHPNVENSPVSFLQDPHFDEKARPNWSVNLKTNLYDFVHPCGTDYFTWCVFGDWNSSFLPNPKGVFTHVEGFYNHWLPNGESRGIIGFQGWWKDSFNSEGRAHLIEISTHSSGWERSVQHPFVWHYLNNTDLEFVSLQSGEWLQGWLVNNNVMIDIAWDRVIDMLVKDGFLHQPSFGWEDTSTQAIYVGHELHNKAVKFSGIADLWFTNFRISE